MQNDLNEKNDLKTQIKRFLDEHPFASLQFLKKSFHDLDLSKIEIINNEWSKHNAEIKLKQNSDFLKKIPIKTSYKEILTIKIVIFMTILILGFVGSILGVFIAGSVGFIIIGGVGTLSNTLFEYLGVEKGNSEEERRFTKTIVQHVYTIPKAISMSSISVFLYAVGLVLIMLQIRFFLG